MRDRLVVELQANLSEIGHLAGQVEAFGNRNNVSAEVIGHINLALDELLTNTISHGFDGPSSDPITVTLGLDDGLITIELVDSGKPFDLFAVADPDISQPIDKRPIGGLGIFLVRRVMDHVDYRQASGQNRVTLIKKTHAPGG